MTSISGSPFWPSGIKLNPRYGTGLFRRRFRISAGSSEVQAGLEDENHAMRLTLRHDGERVTAVDSEMIRIPTTLCPGATTALQTLVGVRLDTPTAELFTVGRARQQCTHLYDLATMALLEALRPGADRQLDFTVADENAGVITAAARKDGQLVHQWAIRDGYIETPIALAGKAVMRGLLPLLSDLYADDELQIAQLLRKALFVAFGRRFLFQKGEPIIANETLIGQCFAYQPERAPEGRFTADTRNFARTPEGLLAFFRDPPPAA